MNEKFKQPWACVGMSVLWFSERSGNNPGSAAIVTEVHDQTISAQVFDASTIGGKPVAGVRHVDDPNLRLHVDNDAGCWDYNDFDKRTKVGDYKKVAADIEAARLAAIEKARQPEPKKAA